MLEEDKLPWREVNPRTWIKQTDYFELDFQPSLDAFAAQRVTTRSEIPASLLRSPRARHGGVEQGRDHHPNCITGGAEDLMDASNNRLWRSAAFGMKYYFSNHCHTAETAYGSAARDMHKVLKSWPVRIGALVLATIVLYGSAYSLLPRTADSVSVTVLQCATVQGAVVYDFPGTTLFHRTFVDEATVSALRTTLDAMHDVGPFITVQCNGGWGQVACLHLRPAVAREGGAELRGADEPGEPMLVGGHTAWGAAGGDGGCDDLDGVGASMAGNSALWWATWTLTPHFCQASRRSWSGALYCFRQRRTTKAWLLLLWSRVKFVVEGFGEGEWFHTALFCLPVRNRQVNGPFIPA